MRLMVLVLAILTCHSGRADPSFPGPIQQKINEVLRDSAAKNLRQVQEQYNQAANHPPVLLSVMESYGLSESDLRKIREYRGTVVLPKAEFRDNEIQIQIGNTKLAINNSEFWTRSIRINGETFQWDPKKTLTENLHRFDRFFQPKNHSKVLIPFINSASADDDGNLLFRVKAAGLTLYFIVDSVGKANAGKEFAHLNTEVVNLMQKCEEGPPKEGEHDAFLTALFSAMQKAQSSSRQDIQLRNCKDIQDLSTKSFVLWRDAAPTHEIPKDLCENLNRLVTCVRGVNAPSTSVTKDRKKQKVDPDEWNDLEAKPKTLNPAK